MTSKAQNITPDNTPIETTAKVAHEISCGYANSLKDLLKKGIERYQDSPVRNKNKLNEALACSLDYPNYDMLSAELAKHTTRPRSKHEVEIKEIETDEFETNVFYFIDGQLIDPEIIYNDSVDYMIIDRYDHIESLSEEVVSHFERDSNFDHNMSIRKRIMRDIIMLEDNPDMMHCDFIITDDMANGFNTYASQYHNIPLFDKACESILKANEDFAKTPRCPDCLSDLTQEDSVEREYFNKHSNEEMVLTGSYDKEEGCFESEEDLSGTEHSNGWDSNDNSDSCSKCGAYV